VVQVELTFIGFGWIDLPLIPATMAQFAILSVAALFRFACSECQYGRSLVY
jgi:hypothetical protein